MLGSKSIIIEDQTGEEPLGGLLSDDEPSVTRRALTMDSVVLSSQGKFNAGEVVVVHMLTSSGQRICVSGEVVRCRQARQGKGYLIKVNLTEYQGVLIGLAPRSLGGTANAAIGQLSRVGGEEAGDLRAENSPHMRGTLEQINLPSLLAFLDRERRSATVCLNGQATGEVRLYLCKGRLVDISGLEGGGVEKEQRRLYQLLKLESGDFELSFTPVNRDDRFGISTPALLLDMAASTD